MMRKILAALGALAAMIASQSALAHVATIDGGYDLSTYDTPELIIHNTSAFVFTNAQMLLTGYQGQNNGVTQTVSLGTLGLGDTNIVWGTGGPLFTYDYDDSKGGTGPCPPNPINAGLCADVGNFSVTFTAIWNGNSIYSVFSPHVNATGSFVGWEGLNPAGLSEDPNYDVHNGTVGGTLAYIDVGTPPQLPEPGTLWLMALCLGILGLSGRFKAN